MSYLTARVTHQFEMFGLVGRASIAMDPDTGAYEIENLSLGGVHLAHNDARWEIIASYLRRTEDEEIRQLRSDIETHEDYDRAAA